MAASHIKVTPTGASLGAFVTGVDLSKPLTDEEVAAIRKAWLDHLVLAFPDQPMSHEDLERFTQYFGPFGDDPFIAPIEGHPHIIEVKRAATEKASVFAAAWHSDWSFQDTPPAGTILHSKITPPVGGDTLFCNGYAAYEALSDEMKAKIEGLKAVHSAALAYAPDGVYGKGDGSDRSMTIKASEDALNTKSHPIVRVHPETGRKALFINPGYVKTVEGLSDEDAFFLLVELYGVTHDERFVYRHKWQDDMLLMWDNRCTQHMATGGYDGHARLMHRTTVAGP
ncbi:MAG: TauD/TfdA family dioxygenase [Oceanicaulis sp.]|uniref:TauD/TfdA dioxygenase family protein n=1 Tax=Glycocaulis sp. TaxID=1969725 RepID=UPI0025BA3C6B|nr:TauD/TfdA family dioxygenase [Glycocaulis sp.]MCC5982260.1 TauD/TfdA family dioxygenase [Oceanicaulis sp.]MCH8522138.1 TauD/TfdA family dioxygenase [Glycocaulis sp.]